MARAFAKAFYNSREWKNCRENILRRDNYLCVKCGKPAEEVHHIIHLSPKNISDINITLNPDNLISLCRDCHFNEHKQDKIQGLKSRANPASGNEYEFDENGFLVSKSPLFQTAHNLTETVGEQSFLYPDGCVYERGCELRKS